MAIYIDDSGTHELDALLNGTEDTAWSRDETNDLIWFSGTGTSTTGFSLPSATAWIVYEVYDVDSHTNDLTDGTNVYAWIEYTSTIGTIATTLETWKTAWESTASTRSYTTYKIKATHYKTGDVADVYYATEAATDFSKAVADGVEDGVFTGYGAWSLSDTMLADGVSGYGPELISTWATDTWGGQPTQLDFTQSGGTLKWTANTTATVGNNPYLVTDTSIAIGDYRATFVMSTNNFDAAEQRQSVYNQTTTDEYTITSESATLVFTDLLSVAYTFSVTTAGSLRINIFDRTDTTVTTGQVLEVTSMSLKKIL